MTQQFSKEKKNGNASDGASIKLNYEVGPTIIFVGPEIISWPIGVYYMNCGIHELKPFV